jgi:hypothetical protein
LAGLLRDLGSMLVQVMSKVEAGNGAGSEEEA